LRRKRVSPDPLALFVIALLSIATISSSADELYGLPRMTVLSVPFTLYMLYAIRGNLHPILVRFVIAYGLAFLPSTLVAIYHGGIKWTSVGQGGLGLVTFMAVGSYFYHWLSFSSLRKKKWSFLFLAVFFMTVALFEIAFPAESFRMRSYLYINYLDQSGLIDREMRVYGIRPTGFFSEPSNFARYIGIMMTAYLAATMTSKGSRWAFVTFMFVTRSISYFVAVPALIVEARRALSAPAMQKNKGVKRKRLRRVMGLAVIVVVLVSAVAYTQAARISDALASNDSNIASISGDSSLNERILIPMGYLFNGRSSIVLGIGLTPQDELNDYAISKTRYIFNFKLSYDDRTAIAATIVTIAGMGLVGIFMFSSVMYFFCERFGLELVASFLIINMFSSGYGSVISLVPSGLILGLIIYQKDRLKRS
jgi:hypothetical protein